MYKNIINIIFILFLLLILKTKCYEMFTDFDDVMDVKCSTLNQKNEYIWDVKKCGPKNCPLETCLVLGKNPITNMYEYTRQRRVQKKKKTNLKHDVFECETNTNKQKNIYCGDNVDSKKIVCSDLHDKQECYDWNENSEKWDKIRYKKYLNAEGKCLWYDLDYVDERSKTKENLNNCVFEKINCSDSNIACDLDGTNFETYKYDKEKKQCVVDKTCETKCTNSMLGYVFNSNKNLYEKKEFRPINNGGDECVYVHDEYCHPIHFDNEYIKTCNKPDDVRDIVNQDAFYYNHAGQQIDVETTDCSTLQPKRCYTLNEKETLVPDIYRAELSKDRTKCIYKNDEGYIKEIDDECYDYRGTCIDDTKYVNLQKKKCMECPDGTYLKYNYELTELAACDKYSDVPLDDWCWTTHPEHGNLEQKTTYPYDTVLKYGLKKSPSDYIPPTYNYVSTAPPNCKKDCNRLISIDDIQYCDNCSSSSECTNKCVPERCLYNRTSSKCECTELCNDRVNSIVECLNPFTNKFNEYRVVQDDKFSQCKYIHRNDDMADTLDTCSHECTQPGQFKKVDETGSSCQIPLCEIDTKYYYTTWDDDTLREYRKKYKSENIEETFQKFNAPTAIDTPPMKCEFATLNRVIYANATHQAQTSCLIDKSKINNSELTSLIDTNIIMDKTLHSVDSFENQKDSYGNLGKIIHNETKERQSNLCTRDCELEIVGTTLPDTICHNLGNATHDQKPCHVDESDIDDYGISHSSRVSKSNDNITFFIKSPNISGGKDCISVATETVQYNGKLNFTKYQRPDPDQIIQTSDTLLEYWYDCDLHKNRCPLDCVKELECPPNPICTLHSSTACRGTYECNEKIKYQAKYGGQCKDIDYLNIDQEPVGTPTRRTEYKECNTCDDPCEPKKDKYDDINYEFWQVKNGQPQIRINSDNDDDKRFFENKFDNWDTDPTFCGEGTLTKKRRATTKCLDPMQRGSISPIAIQQGETYITSELDTKTAMSCSDREITIINYVNEIIQNVDAATTPSELISLDLDDALATIIAEYPSIAPFIDEIRKKREEELRIQGEIISNQEYKNELCPLEFYMDEMAHPLVPEVVSPLRQFDENNADLVNKIHQIGKYYDIPFEKLDDDRLTYCYARAAAGHCMGEESCPDTCSACTISDMVDVGNGVVIEHCPEHCTGCMNDPCSAECNDWGQLYRLHKSQWDTWPHKRVFTPTGITEERTRTCEPNQEPVEQVGYAEPVKDTEDELANELEQQQRDEPLDNLSPQDYTSFFMQCNEDGNECRQYRRATCVNGTLNGHKNRDCDGSGCVGHYYTTLTPSARERILQITGGYFQVLDNGDLIHSTGRNTSEKQVANIFHRMVSGAYIADTARNEWLNTTETNEMIAIYEFKDQERRPLLRDVNRIKLWNANTGDYFAGNVKIFIWDTGYYSGEKNFIPVTNQKYSTNTQGFSTPPRRAELLQIDFDMVLTTKIKIVINKHESNTNATFGISYCKIELFNWNDATIYYGTILSRFFYDQFNNNFDKNIVTFNDYINRTNVNQITIPEMTEISWYDELTWQNEWMPPSSSLKDIIVRSHRGAMDWWNRTIGEFSDWREETQIVANVNGSEMRANDKIYPPMTTGSRTKHYIISDNGCFRLFLRNDGNLVVQRVGGLDPPTYWRSNTPGTPKHFTLTEDGDLRLLNTNDEILWSSIQEFDHGLGADRLKIESDGTLVLYKGTQIIWKPALFMNGVRVHSLDCQIDHPRAYDIQQCNEQCIDKNIDPTDPSCNWGYEYQYKRGFIWHFIKLYYDWKIPTGNPCYGGLAIDLDGSREAWIIAASGNIDPESDVFDNPYSQENIWYGNLDLENGDGSSQFVYDTVFERLEENLDYSIDFLTKAHTAKNNSDYIDFVVRSHEKIITYQREVTERYDTVVNDVSDLREQLTESSGLASDLTVDDKNTNSCVANFEYIQAVQDGYWGEDITTISDNIDNKLTIKINKIDYVIDTVKNTINIDVELENKTDKPIYFYALAHNTPKIGSQDFKFIANDMFNTGEYNRKYRSLLQKILFINQSKSNQTFKNHQTKHVIISNESKNFTFKIHDFIDIKDTIEPEPTSQANEDELKRRLLRSSTNLNYEIKDIDISSLCWITIYADENEPTDFYKTLFDKGLDAMRKHLLLSDQSADRATLASLYYTRLVNVLDKIEQVFNFTFIDSIDTIEELKTLRGYVDNNSEDTLTEDNLNDGLNALLDDADILQKLCLDSQHDERDAQFRVTLRSVIEKLDLIYEYCITLDVIRDNEYTKLKDFKSSLDNIIDRWYAGEASPHHINDIGKNKLGFSHVAGGRGVGDDLYCESCKFDKCSLDLVRSRIKYDVDVNNPAKMKQDCGYSEDKVDQRYSCRTYFKIEDPDSSYNKLERILMNNNYNETYAKLENNQNRFVILKRILNDPEKLRPCLSSAQIASSDDEYYSHDMRSDTFLNEDSSSQPVVDPQVRVFKEKLKEAITIKDRVFDIKGEIDDLRVYVNQRYDWFNQGEWHLNPNRDRNQIVGDYIPICNSSNNFDDTYMYFSEESSGNQLLDEDQWIACSVPLFRKKNQNVDSNCNERKFCDLYMLCNNIEKRVAVDADQQNKLNTLKSLCDEQNEKPEHQGLYIFSKKESCEFHFRKNENNDFTTLVDLSPTSTNMCDLWYSQLSNNLDNRSQLKLNSSIIELNATTVGKQTQTNTQTKNKLTIENGRLTSPNPVDDVWVFSVKREVTPILRIPTTDELQTVATQYTLLADSETYHQVPTSTQPTRVELNQLSLTKTFSSLDGSDTEPITDDGDYWVVVVAKQGNQYHAAYRQTPAPATDLTNTSYIEWWANHSNLIDDDYGYTESNYFNDWLKDDRAIYPLFRINKVLAPTHENAIGYSRWTEQSFPKIINASIKVDKLDWELDILTNQSFENILVQCLIYEYSTYRKMGPDVEIYIHHILSAYPENSFRTLYTDYASFYEIFNWHWVGPGEGNEHQQVITAWEKHVKDITKQIFETSSKYKSYGTIIGDFIWDNNVDTSTLKFHRIKVGTKAPYTPLLKSLAKHNVIANPEDLNPEILNNEIWISGLGGLKEKLRSKLIAAAGTDTKDIDDLLPTDDDNVWSHSHVVAKNKADDDEWKKHFYYFRINSIIPSEKTNNAKIKFSDLQKRTETSIFGSVGQSDEFELKPDTKYQMALLSTINSQVYPKFKLNFINFHT